MYQSPDGDAPGGDPAEVPTVAALLRWGASRLRDQGTAGARDAQLLLAAASGVSRAVIASAHERRISNPERARYQAWIERRVLGEPAAYLIGRREFWSLDLMVTPDVLVPRPETELLVERALELRGAAPELAVLDLGTGCGAIALALARERPGWRVTAADVSPAALVLARANAAALGLDRIELLAGSWFEPVVGRRFDLVVANPPYVAQDDPALRGPELRYEPRLALTPGPDPFAALRILVAQAPEHLAPRGVLLLEHGATQAPQLAEMLVARGFGHVRSRCDLAGHERVTEAEWPGN
jgi:release factor glutamine methyltransferase